MVVDASVIWQRQGSMELALAALGDHPERGERGERKEESPEERSARVHYLAALVKSGEYAVHSRRLATALLEWDPRRSNPKQSAEVADRRRAYMREYMRRRRAMSGGASGGGDVGDGDGEGGGRTPEAQASGYV